jgi:hypothetical protein
VAEDEKIDASIALEQFVGNTLESSAAIFRAIRPACMRAATGEARSEIRVQEPERPN